MSRMCQQQQSRLSSWNRTLQRSGTGRGAGVLEGSVRTLQRSGTGRGAGELEGLVRTLQRSGTAAGELGSWRA